MVCGSHAGPRTQEKARQGPRSRQTLVSPSRVGWSSAVDDAIELRAGVHSHRPALAHKARAAQHQQPSLGQASQRGLAGMAAGAAFARTLERPTLGSPSDLFATICNADVHTQRAIFVHSQCILYAERVHIHVTRHFCHSAFYGVHSHRSAPVRCIECAALHAITLHLFLFACWLFPFVLLHLYSC